MWRSLLALLLVACPEGPPAGDDTGHTDDTAQEQVDWTERSDEDIVRALIDGTGPDLQDALHLVAWRDGFPVRTESGTFLFVVESDGSTPWALAGEFDGWSPAAMTAGAGFHWAEVAIAEPAGQRYKFTHDAVWTADRWARAFEYDENGEISFVAPPTDRARLDRWPDLVGQGLLPRDVTVLVPQGSGPWPVLYAEDGQNLFDPEAFWGGWHLQDAVAALEQPILVVGVDSTADRFDEYSHVVDVIDGWEVGGRASLYAALLHDDLRPHIEAVYGSTGRDGLLGSSMGGLVSLYVAHAYPTGYDFVASMSGTLGWGRLGAENPTIEELYVPAGHRDFAIYVDSGGGDGGNGCTDPDLDGFPEDDPEGTDNYCMNRHFADRMAELGYTWDEDLFHWHEPDALHNEAAWADRVHRPLELFAE